MDHMLVGLVLSCINLELDYKYNLRLVGSIRSKDFHMVYDIIPYRFSYEENMEWYLTLISSSTYKIGLLG